MIAARKVVTSEKAPSALTDVAVDLLCALKTLTDPYRPEQHYMRGPGPKWHAKHDPAPATADAAEVPALVSVNH
jgi:hypothetical protein